MRGLLAVKGKRGKPRLRGPAPLCYQPGMVLSLLLAGLLAAGTDGTATDRLTAALAQEESGDAAGALEALERLVAEDPQWALPRLEAARLGLSQGVPLERVQAHLEVATSRQPENPRGRYLLGLLWEERGEPQRAASEHEQALRYRTSYVEARLRLAGLRAAQGEWAEAARHYRLLRRTREDGVQVRLGLAQALERQGHLKEALREVKALHRRYPRNTLVLRRLAELYEHSGLHRQAKALRARLEPPRRKLRSLKPSRR